ncbi:hypothetical protein FHR70_000665 [Microvirga lupini]|uniref:Uncharacterized protein n=1 Tax=Microvirga lupini TaxID=420324 RepID=A0A7W4VIY6_9HYPH|nr:hypothetical protein [Microvirga lupini]MBB3017625.1 hypothetical protein [Microvirga lupini]
MNTRAEMDLKAFELAQGLAQDPGRPSAQATARLQQTILAGMEWAAVDMAGRNARLAEELHQVKQAQASAAPEQAKTCDCNQGRLPCSCKQVGAAPEQEPVAWVKGGTFCRLCGTKLCVTGVCTIYCPNRDCGFPGRGTKGLTEPEIERLKDGEPLSEQQPVTLPKRKDTQEIAEHGHGTWNQCLDEIAKLGPLFTHADPSEGERLLADKERWASNCLKVLKKAAELEGQLEAAIQRADAAERHAADLRNSLVELNGIERKRDAAFAILRDWLDTDLGKSSPAINNLRRKTDYLLSASAEPTNVGDGEVLGERCIDGGTCHHDCKTRCFRRECCTHFSDYTGPWAYPTEAQRHE